NADGIAAVLARDDYLGVDRDAIRASLPGGGTGHSVFFGGGANFPQISHATWFLSRMAQWGYLGQDVDRAALADAVYRPDLFSAAAAKLGLSVPADNKNDCP